MIETKRDLLITALLSSDSAADTYFIVCFILLLPVIMLVGFLYNIITMVVLLLGLASVAAACAVYFGFRTKRLKKELFKLMLKRK